MDLLEHTAVDDVIILSVVLDEVKHKNQSVYQRLRALCASQSRRFFVFANENHRCVYLKSHSDVEVGCKQLFRCGCQRAQESPVSLPLH